MVADKITLRRVTQLAVMTTKIEKLRAEAQHLGLESVAHLLEMTTLELLDTTSDVLHDNAGLPVPGVTKRH